MVSQVVVSDAWVTVYRLNETLNLFLSHLGRT